MFKETDKAKSFSGVGLETIKSVIPSFIISKSVLGFDPFADGSPAKAFSFAFSWSVSQLFFLDTGSVTLLI